MRRKVSTATALTFYSHFVHASGLFSEIYIIFLKPLLHLVVQEWLRSNSHVTALEHSDTSSSERDNDASVKDGDEQKEQHQQHQHQSTASVSSPVSVSSPTRASVHGRSEQVGPMRKLLRSLLLELLPPPNNGKNNSNKNRRGSVIGAMAFRARDTSAAVSASGGITDNDVNAAKRILLELKPFIKTKKFTESWTLDKPVEEFVYIMDDGSASTPSSSATSSSSFVSSFEAGGKKAAHHAANGDDERGRRIVRGVVVGGDEDDDEDGESVGDRSEREPRRFLGSSASAPGLLSSASSKSGGGVGSEPKLVTGLNLQGCDVVGHLDSEVAPLLRRLGRCGVGKAKDGGVKGAQGAHLARLDLRFNGGLSGSLGAFGGRTDVSFCERKDPHSRKTLKHDLIRCLPPSTFERNAVALL